MSASQLFWLSSALCLWLLQSPALCRDSAGRPVLRKPPGSAGTGCYFVVLRDKTSQEEMQQVMATISKLADDSKIHSIIKKISKTFTVQLSPYALEMVRRMPAVDYIEEEGFAVGTQEDHVAWHLDRLDQILPTLDHAYNPIGDGAGVDVYILDSGINYEHQEFEYRAKYAGLDPTDDYLTLSPSQRLNGRDCHGHGTHVASLCGGRNFGTAKKATLYSVRVLGCNNAGPWSVVLAGIEHAVTQAEASHRPSILSMSFSGDRYNVVNNAVSYALSRGVHAIMAAGNGGTDSCARSPAGTVGGIAVAGTRQGDGLYSSGPGTNFGTCVSIFAPGQRVLGADRNCNNCSKFLSGTSMSAPLVSGLAAILLGREPMLSPAQLRTRLLDASIKDVVNFEGMPANFRNITPNRLATIPGSCGERDSPMGSSTFSSPGFPTSYPPNLDCRWEIGGMGNLRVNLTIFFLRLELQHDVLRVFDGCCENRSGLLDEFTGDLNHLNRSFASTTNLICLQLVTDGTLTAAGFNASFVKTYAGTDLVVPNPPTPLPVPEEGVDTDITISLSPRQARDKIQTLITGGHKLTWISSTRLGPSRKPYFDFVATNSSTIDTISYVEIRFNELNQTIFRLKEEGYFVKLLIDRIRGRNSLEPSYSVIFERRDPIYETRVFLRDSYQAYTSRLSTNTKAGFRLLSQSFCSIQGVIEATSVYVRDRRIPFGIPTPSQPGLVVRSNLTFFQFTTETLRKANEGYYPFAVEVFTQGSTSDSYFSVVYEERSGNSQGNWFRWSLNTTAARDIIERETRSTSAWDVYLTVGYTYLGYTEHFIEFKRKGT